MTTTPPVITRAAALRQLTAPGQPHELAEQTINGVPCRVFVNAPQSLRELFAGTTSDLPFLVYNDERLSFAATHTLASRLATYLMSQCGVVPGDRVAIAMRNYPEWVIGFTAITSIGAIAVAMNAWWQAEEIEMGLADCGAKVIIADEERLARLAQFNPTLHILAVREGESSAIGTPWSSMLAQTEGVRQMPNVSVDADAPATIFYTSGSTGFPKGALASHRNIISALLSWELDAQSAVLTSGITRPETSKQPATLLAVPLFHATGSHAVYLSSYRSQRKMVCMYRWDPAEAARLIEQERITNFIAPAAMTGDLVNAARSTQRDLSSLVLVGGGGAPRAPEQVRDINSAFATAMPNTGWGMTETNAIGTGIGGVDYLERPASSGRASAVVDLKVVDEAGNTLPVGERGELLIRGVSVIQGYWQRPEANAETFVEGWLKTGDVAYLDDEGYLFIVDRVKDLIIRGGENIGCGEVEAALLEHADVLEASVYAIPDERLGEEVACSVYGERAVSAEALRQFLSARLAKFKVPRYIDIRTEQLPRIASGKIFKRALRDATIQRIQSPASSV